MKCRILLLIAGLLISLIGYSQVTTSRIDGVVDDATGETLIGATVTATHVPTGALYGTTTRVDGSFTLPNLKVGGPYTIDVSYIGYQSFSEGNVFLQLGQKYSFAYTLQDEASQLDEVVIIASRNDQFSSDRTGAATNISSDQIKKLPTISRSAEDYTRLTPAASGNSFGGRNDQFNNFSLDGSIFNNPFGLDAATPGGQSDAQPISLDAIDQIQVSIAPYDVTQSGFTGAAINAVTKSGTNKFSGTVFGFFRNEDLTGSTVDGQDIVVSDLQQFQTGFSLGGPIIKNKLFFFVNAEIDRRETAASNILAGRPGLSGSNISRVQAADLDLVSSLLKERFGYETGIYENIPHDIESDKGIIKLDWNISNNHKLSANYNFLSAFRQLSAHPSAIGRRGPDVTTLQFQNSGYQINNDIKSGIVELNSIFGNKFANQLQVGYTAFRDNRDPFSAPFPVLNIGKDGIRYIVAGHEPFSINNVLSQDVFQITNNFNIYLKSHTFTIGSSFESFKFDNSFNLVSYGFSVFCCDIPIEDFEETINSGALDADAEAAPITFETNNANDSWALAELNLGQWGIYGQDEFLASRDLTLTLGLRVDLPLYFNTEDNIIPNNDPITYFDETGATVSLDNTKLPDRTPLFSPRFGFNYNVNGEGMTQVRGGSGMFAGRLPFVWIGNQVANPFTGFLNVTDQDFQFPQVWRSNLGIDHKFGQGWTATADLIYTKDLNAPFVNNFALGTPSGSLNAPGDNRPSYTAIDVVLNPDDPFGGRAQAYVFNTVSEGRSINASFQLQRNWANGLYASIAYNYLDAKDLSSIDAEISSDAFDRNPSFGNVNVPRLAPSIYGNKHRIVGVLSKGFEYGANNRFGTSIAVFFEYAEGNRFNYTYSGDINNDSSPLNDLIYIPSDGEVDQMQFSGDEASQRSALKAFIAQDDYLSANRGQVAEKYAILTPWFSTWDVRILQDFNIAGSNTLQFSWDILNFGNLISSSWGVRQLPSNTQPISVTSVDGSGVPTFGFDTSLSESFTDDLNLLSRWQMQFGLRYSF